MNFHLTSIGAKDLRHVCLPQTPMDCLKPLLDQYQAYQVAYTFMTLFLSSSMLLLLAMSAALLISHMSIFRKIMRYLNRKQYLGEATLLNLH